MKQILVAVIMGLGLMSLTACVDNSTPERAKVLKEMADFQKKCVANPQDAECVEYKKMYGGA